MVLCLLLAGCDDGEMNFSSFNFNNAQISNCNDNFVYAINRSEVLILDLDDSAFINQPTEPGNPRIITINSSNKVIYRNYSANVNSAVICSAIPPAQPSVLEESNAVEGGTLQIISTPNINDEGKLTGYNHQVRLINVNFMQGENIITFTNALIGTYTKPMDYNFDFSGTEENPININTCGNGLFYKRNQREALLLIVDDPETLFINEPTPENQPRTMALNAGNQVLFRVYSANISDAFMCAQLPPATPVIQQSWTTQSTPEGNSQIEVATTYNEAENAYMHAITFKNILFVKGNEQFGFASYTFGVYTTQP